MTGHRSRLLEDIGFLVGLLVVVIYVLGVEVAPQVCHSIGRCAQPQHHEFPWGVFWMVAVCVAPKMLGRVSAGKVWAMIGPRIPGVEQKPDTDGTAGNGSQ